MKFVNRASFGWGPTAAGYAPCRNGLVIHYNGGNTGLYRKPHSSCVSYWKNTRRFHMSGRGWLDIGYSFGVCPHGFVFEGRGWQKNQAAQPGGNTTWTSCTLMSGPDEDPTPAQIQGVRELRQWLRGKGLRSAVKGHRDFYATACPGNRLYALVRNGTFAKAPGKTTAPKEDDVPKYLNASADIRDLAPGTWATGTLSSGSWKGDYAHVLDAKDQSYTYDADVYVQCRGEPGVTVQVKVEECERGDYGNVRQSWILDENRVTSGGSWMCFSAKGWLESGRQLRFLVVHYGPEAMDVRINPVLHYWET